MVKITEEKIKNWQEEKIKEVISWREASNNASNQGEVSVQEVQEIKEDIEQQKKKLKDKEKNKIKKIKARLPFEIIIGQITNDHVLGNNGEKFKLAVRTDKIFSGNGVVKLDTKDGEGNSLDINLNSMSVEDFRNHFKWSREEITKKIPQKEESLELAELLNKTKKIIERLEKENKNLKNQLKDEEGVLWKYRAQKLEKEGRVLFRDFIHFVGRIEKLEKEKGKTISQIKNKSRQGKVRSYLESNRKAYREKNLINWQEWRSVSSGGDKQLSVWEWAKNNLKKLNKEINESNAHQVAHQVHNVN